jgi:hypothetical protein
MATAKSVYVQEVKTTKKDEDGETVWEHVEANGETRYQLDLSTDEAKAVLGALTAKLGTGSPEHDHAFDALQYVWSHGGVATRR